MFFFSMYTCKKHSHGTMVPVGLTIANLVFEGRRIQWWLQGHRWCIADGFNEWDSGVKNYCLWCRSPRCSWKKSCTTWDVHQLISRISSMNSTKFENFSFLLSQVYLSQHFLWKHLWSLITSSCKDPMPNETLISSLRPDKMSEGKHMVVWDVGIEHYL